MKYLNDFFKSVLKGFQSIGEGMSTISIYQPSIKKGYNTEDNGLRKDVENLA